MRLHRARRETGPVPDLQRRRGEISIPRQNDFRGGGQGGGGDGAGGGLRRRPAAVDRGGEERPQENSGRFRTAARKGEGREDGSKDGFQDRLQGIRGSHGRGRRRD